MCVPKINKTVRLAETVYDTPSLTEISSPASPVCPVPFQMSSLYVFSNSLTRFVDLFGGFPLQRLMRAHLIVVEQILLQFVPELRQGGERGAVDQVVVQGPPEPFHLPIGLRADRAGYTDV